MLETFVTTQTHNQTQDITRRPNLTSSARNPARRPTLAVHSSLHLSFRINIIRTHPPYLPVHIYVNPKRKDFVYQHGLTCFSFNRKRINATGKQHRATVHLTQHQTGNAARVCSVFAANGMRKARLTLGKPTSGSETALAIG